MQIAQNDGYVFHYGAHEGLTLLYLTRDHGALPTGLFYKFLWCRAKICVFQGCCRLTKSALMRASWERGESNKEHLKRYHNGCYCCQSGEHRERQHEKVYRWWQWTAAASKTETKKKIINIPQTTFFNHIFMHSIIIATTTASILLLLLFSCLCIQPRQ